MANKPSSKKAIRTIARRTEVNRDRRSRVRSFIRKVNEAVEAKSADSRTVLVKAESELMRAAQKGLLPRKRAARKISRLAKAVKAASLSA